MVVGRGRHLGVRLDGRFHHRGHRHRGHQDVLRRRRHHRCYHLGVNVRAQPELGHGHHGRAEEEWACQYAIAEVLAEEEWVCHSPMLEASLHRRLRPWPQLERLAQLELMASLRCR